MFADDDIRQWTCDGCAPPQHSLSAADVPTDTAVDTADGMGRSTWHPTIARYPHPNHTSVGGGGALREGYCEPTSYGASDCTGAERARGWGTRQGGVNEPSPLV